MKWEKPFLLLSFAVCWFSDVIYSLSGLSQMTEILILAFQRQYSWFGIKIRIYLGSHILASVVGEGDDNLGTPIFWGPPQPILFFNFRFDVFMNFWFFRPIVGPLRNMRRKTSSRFPICTKLSAKEAKAAFASFKPTLTGIGKWKEVFRRMFRRGPLRS